MPRIEGGTAGTSRAAFLLGLPGYVPSGRAGTLVVIFTTIADYREPAAAVAMIAG